MHLGENLSTTETLPVSETRPYVSLMLLITNIITVILFLYVRKDKNPLSNVPLVTKKSIWDISGKKAKESFAANARAVVKQGFEKV